MKKREERKLMLSLLNMSEYAWICLNKQDSEYALSPKFAEILNMAKFWICRSFKMVNMSEQDMNIPEYVWILNMAGF